MTKYLLDPFPMLKLLKDKATIHFSSEPLLMEHSHSELPVGVTVSNYKRRRRILLGMHGTTEQFRPIPSCILMKLFA